MNNPQDSDNTFDTNDSESDADTTVMSFLEHLEEFRWTVARLNCICARGGRCGYFTT